MALQLFQELREAGHELNLVAFSATISACQKVGSTALKQHIVSFHMLWIYHIHIQYSAI